MVGLLGDLSSSDVEAVEDTSEKLNRSEVLAIMRKESNYFYHLFCLKICQ